MLPSETNNPEIDDAVKDAFAASDLSDFHPDYSTAFEHGQWWVICKCGASWSVVDTQDGFDFEQVSDGDEDYHETE